MGQETETGERGQFAWGMAAAHLILEASQDLTLSVTSDFPFFLKLILFCTVLGLHCCTGFSVVMESGGSSLVVVCGLLIVMASLVTEHRHEGLSACI